MEALFSNEFIDRVLSCENAIWHNEESGGGSVTFSSDSTAHTILATVVKEFEHSSSLIPVSVSAEWSEPFSRGSASIGEQYFQGILDDVHYIAQGYKDVVSEIAVSGTIYSQHFSRAPVIMRSTSTALHALVECIENPVKMKGSRGYIERLEPGEYICNLVLSFGNFHIKIRLFRKYLIKKTT